MEGQFRVERVRGNEHEMGEMPIVGGLGREL